MEKEDLVGQDHPWAQRNGDFTGRQSSDFNTTQRNVQTGQLGKIKETAKMPRIQLKLICKNTYNQKYIYQIQINNKNHSYFWE